MAHATFQMRLRQRLLFVSSLGLLLAGCATYRSEPISPADNATALESRTLDNSRLRHFIRTSLPSLPQSHGQPFWGLGALTLAALYYHPDLDVARAKLAASRAGVLTARQRPNPTLSFSAVYDATSPIAFPFTIGPAINFLIETFGRREARTAQAQHLVGAARWNLATAGWQVRGRVRAALLALWAGQHRLALAQRRLTLQQELVRLLESRFRVGEASAVNVMQERINLAQIDLSRRAFERSITEARAQLAAAVSIPLSALDGIRITAAAFDKPVSVPLGLAVGELRWRALTGRTDIRAALSDYEAAQSALRLQIANQYPNVTLGPGYNYDVGQNKFLLSPGLDPLPVLNQNQGPVAEALANCQQAAATFTALQAQVMSAIDSAAVAYRTAARSLTAANALVTDARRRAQQVAASFRAGAVDRPTLVTAETELAAVQASQFDALVLQKEALGALEDALEQPLFDRGAWPAAAETDLRVAAVKTARS
jgi:outer membrane protein, heavy metal efflux system